MFESILNYFTVITSIFKAFFTFISGLFDSEDENTQIPSAQELIDSLKNE